MLEIIRKGDGTDHGGTVLEGFAHTNLNGSPIAGVGHQVSCPQCNGVFVIEEGSARYKINGIPVALSSMPTSCGARLIASASRGRVDG